MQGTDTPTRGGPTRLILLVDRDPELRRVVYEYLGYFKMRVAGAASVEEARELLKVQVFDAFVIDDEVAGVARLQPLVQVSAERVVVVSPEPRRRIWSEVGVRHFLSKPFDVRDLQILLDEIFVRSAARGS